VDNSYSALVRGPSPVLPRGSVRLIVIFYVIIAGVIIGVADFPVRYAAVFLLIIALAAGGTTWLRATSCARAFAADADGIVLGRDTADAPRKEVPWKDIQGLRISPTRHGALLEVLLSPAAPVSVPGLLQNVALMAIPGGVTRRPYTPALLAPLGSPPRYRIPLTGVSPEQLRFALGSLGPPTMQIEIAG
jgi:hypothetical protein